MKFCSGMRCPIQWDKIDPFNCKLTIQECPYRTEIDTENDYFRGFSDGIKFTLNSIKNKEKEV